MGGGVWDDGRWMTEGPKLTGPMDNAFWLGSVIFDGGRAIKGVAPDLDRHAARCLVHHRGQANIRGGRAQPQAEPGRQLSAGLLRPGDWRDLPYAGGQDSPMKREGVVQIGE